MNTILNFISEKRHNALAIEGVGLESRLVFARPEENIINSILSSLDESTNIIRCSVCGREIEDHKDIGAIYPYKSALVCCKKIECILECSDKLLADDFIHT